MARTTTAVSVRSDRDYVAYLYVLARNLNKPIADIVREAIDEKHGADLAHIAATFRASLGKKTTQRKAK